MSLIGKFTKLNRHQEHFDGPVLNALVPGRLSVSAASRPRYSADWPSQPRQQRSWRTAASAFTVLTRRTLGTLRSALHRFLALHPSLAPAANSRLRRVTTLPIIAALVITSVVWLTATPSANAAINEQLNFQARLLNDSGGLVADGNYNVQFNIYSGGDGDPDTADEVLEWTGTHLNGNSDGVRVANGYLSVQLGSSTSQVNTLSDVDWNNGTLWLSINIGDTGSATTCATEANFNTNCAGDGEMDPFMRLTSTPYAFNANNLDGRDSTEFVQLDPGATPQAISTANAAIAVNQTGAGNILRLQGSGSDVLTLSTGGTLTVGNNSTVGTLTLSDGTTNTGAIALANFDGNYTLTIPNPGQNDTFCLEALGNCAAGGVADLQDAYDGSGTPATIVTTSATKNIILQSGTGFDSTTMFQILDADGGNPVLSVDTTNERVGIGTSTPTTPLDIADATAGIRVRAGNDQTLNTKNQLLFSHNGTTNYTQALKTRHSISNGYGNAIDFYVWNPGVDAAGDVGTEHVLSIQGTASGSVGINSQTTAIAATLTVNNETDTQDILRIQDNGNTQFVVKDGGQVGIGVNTSPSSVTLDIGSVSGINNALRLRQGNTLTGSTSNQILLSYGGGTQYTHAIKSRHDAGNDGQNAIDFFVWDQGTDTDTTIGTNRVFTVDGGNSGSIGVNTGTAELPANLVVNNETSTADIVQIQDNGTAVFVIQDGGNVGIGDTTPAALLTVGNGDLFQVNSSGAIQAAAGITSSGTITFSGLNCTTNANGGALTADASGVISCSDDDGGAGSSLFTDGGTFAYLTTTTDDLILGDTAVATADIFLGDTGSAVFNEQGLDSDFRVEGDTDTNLLFVDASTNRIGIGTNAPGMKLDVSTSILNGNFDGLRLTNTAAEGSAEVGIDFYNSVVPFSSARLYSRTGASFLAPDFTIQVADGSQVLQDRLRIDVNGATTLFAGTLNLGTTTQLGTLNLFDGASNTAAITTADQSGNRTFTIPAAASDNFCLENLGNCTGGGITGSGSNGQVSFWTGASTQGGNAGFIWDNTNTRLGVNDATPDATLDIHGDLFVSTDGSSAASPRVGAFADLTAGEAARFQFGDAANAFQLEFGSALDIYSYHTLRLIGDRNSVTAPAFSTESNIGVHAINTIAASQALVVTGAISQSADLLVLENSGATDLFRINASGAIAQAAGITSSGTITFSGLNCTGNTNGGALTADASGVISCSDDDGGAGSSLFTDGGTFAYLTTTTDDIVFGASTDQSAKLSVIGDADEIQLRVKANATQTTNLLAVFENSAGGDLITFSGTGAAVFNEQGNDADFRVEGDANANLLFVDASTDRVGIGTASPQVLLEVAETTGANIRLTRDDTSIISGNALGVLSFYSNDTEVTSSNVAAQISVLAAADFTSDAAPSDIAFQTQSISGNLTTTFTVLSGASNSEKGIRINQGQNTHATLEVSDSQNLDNDLQLKLTADGGTTSNYFVFSDEGRFGVNGTTVNSVPDALIDINGSFSASAWGLNGTQLQVNSGTFTDSSTAASGTATNAVFNNFDTPTLAATNATVTTTNAATVYIQGAPTAGTNQTITNPYALWVDNGAVRLEYDSTNTTAATERSLQMVLSDTGVVTTGTDTTIGHSINITRTGATGGTINTTGLDIGVTGDGGGTSTAIGLNINVTGADTNYAAIFQGGRVGIADTTPDATLDVQTLSSSTVGLIVQGTGGQSADLLQVMSGTGINRLRVTSDGHVLIGDTTALGNLRLYDGSNHTATIRTLDQSIDRVIEIPITTANDTFCLEVLDNCAAGGVADLQDAYDGSTSPEIVLDSTRGALTVHDNATPLAANLLEVQNNAGTINYLAVSAATTTIGSNQLLVQNQTDSTNAYQFLDQDGGTPILNIDSTNERVGIGTASPASVLNVSGLGLNAGGTADLIVTGTGTTGSGITLSATGTGGVAYTLMSTANAASPGGGKFAVYNDTANNYVFVLEPNGRTSFGSTPISTAYMFLSAPSGVEPKVKGWTQGAAAANDLNFYESGTGNMVLQTNVSSGIVFKTAGSNTRLTVESDGDVLFGASGAAGVLRVSDGSSNYVSLTASGVGSDFTLTLPTTAGSANECLANSATPGILTFTTCGSGSSLFTDGGTFAYLTTTTDDIVFGASTNQSAKLSVIGDADEIQLRVKANATQTTNLLAVFENSAGSDLITFSGTGAAVFNEQGADADFRVEATGQPNALFVQGSDGFVGIGTNAPEFPLHIANGSGNSFVTFDSYGGGALFQGRRANGTPGLESALLSDDLISQFTAKGYGATAWSGTRGGISINAAENWTDTVQGTKLNFWTTPVGSNVIDATMVLESSSTDVRLSLDTIDPGDYSIFQFQNGGIQEWHLQSTPDGSIFEIVESGVAARVSIEEGTGHVGIGDTTPDNLLDIEGASADGTPLVTIQNSTSSGELLYGYNTAGFAVFELNVTGSNTATVEINNEDGSESLVFDPNNAGGRKLIITTDETDALLKLDSINDGNSGLEFREGGGGSGLNILYNGTSNAFVLQTTSAADGTDNVLTIQRSSGAVLFQNHVDSQTAFQIKDAGGTNFLTVDTETATNTRIIQVGSASSDATGVLLVVDSSTAEPTGVAGAIYYDSTNNKFRCYTTSWGDCDTGGSGGGSTVRVTLSPEFAGGTLHADGSSNNGTMTADYDTTARRNYYDWTSSQVSLQDYDIVISTAIPSDYASGLTGFNLWAWATSTNTANNDINVQVLDASGTSCYSGSELPASASTWSEQGFTLSGCTFAANDTITIIVKVSALSSNSVRVGPLRFEYTN